MKRTRNFSAADSFTVDPDFPSQFQTELPANIGIEKKKKKERKRRKKEDEFYGFWSRYLTRVTYSSPSLIRNLLRHGREFLSIWT